MCNGGSESSSEGNGIFDASTGLSFVFAGLVGALKDGFMRVQKRDVIAPKPRFELVFFGCVADGTVRSLVLL